VGSNLRAGIPPTCLSRSSESRPATSISPRATSASGKARCAAYIEVAEAIEAGEPISIELLYSDQVGGQRTITRFGLLPVTHPDTGEASRIASVNRHWFLDRPGPRSDPEIALRAQEIMRSVEASAEEAQATEADVVLERSENGASGGTDGARESATTRQ
jgi:hypothetical protein